MLVICQMVQGITETFERVAIDNMALLVFPLRPVDANLNNAKAMTKLNQFWCSFHTSSDVLDEYNELVFLEDDNFNNARIHTNDPSGTSCKYMEYHSGKNDRCLMAEELARFANLLKSDPKTNTRSCEKFDVQYDIPNFRYKLQKAFGKGSYGQVWLASTEEASEYEKFIVKRIMASSTRNTSTRSSQQTHTDISKFFGMEQYKDQENEMKETIQKNEEIKSRLGRIKTGRGTNGLNQTNAPCTMLDIPSPSSEEEILEALKDTTPLITPKIGEPQDKWNRELFTKIVGVARFVNKMKALKSNYSVTFCTSDDNLTGKSEMDTMMLQRTGNGDESTKAIQLELELEREKASTADGGISKSREPSHELIYGGKVTLPRDAPENPVGKIQQSQSANIPPRKKTTLTLNLNNSISTTEQRKLVRKWNYVKAIIDDIQHALRENPDSITTATLLEESSDELQQIMQGIEASLSGLVPVLKKLANEMRNQSLDRETVKREKLSNLTSELNSLNEFCEQYKELAKQYKRELEVHESKLERVVKRRQLHDIKILDQLDKIEKIKFELAEAEEELEKLERNRYDFLEEEDELKEQSNATKVELGDIMKKIDVSKENVHRVNFQIENLDEAMDMEFDTRSNEMQGLVQILLDLEVQ